jgi:uncharacterized damage-inducible protein DinB
MSISAPQSGEYNPYYYEYIRRVPAGDVLAFMSTQIAESLALLRSLGEEQAMLRPAPGEWNIKEIIGHMCDTERIFAYRALRVGRGDQTALPGFDQDPYVANGNFSQRALADLCDEFAAIRQASLALFRNFTPEATIRMGVASENPVSVRALIYICAGHEHHHMESIRQVYLRQAI